MFTHGKKNFAQSNDATAIQTQRVDRCATNGRKANHVRKLVAPSEMRAPGIPPRVIEWNPCTRYWITRVDFIVFVIVASLTGQREIIEIIRATTNFGDDMLD